MKRTFAYHKPGEEGLGKITKLRKAFSEVSEWVDQLCPGSREASLAQTKIEEAAMWAIKAIVINDPASQPEDIKG